MKRRKTNPGHFKRGHDPRRSTYQLTKEDCRKGYFAALDKMMNAGWEATAWFLRMIRSHYRKVKHGQKKARRKASRRQPSGCPGNPSDIPF